MSNIDIDPNVKVSGYVSRPKSIPKY